MCFRISKRVMVVFIATMLSMITLQAAQMQIALPLGRVAYQTNERIDIAVTRSDAQALAADLLALVVTGEDGSKLSFSFPVPAIAVTGNEARTTEHYHLNGQLLRPGKYQLEATANGASAITSFSLFSHLRKSTFRLLEWGSRAKGDEQALLGEDSLGFNTNYTMYGGVDVNAMIRGGVDYMPCCALGGGHQVGLRLECDWSDPYVLQGSVIATSAYHALMNRTAPNCLGIHFYDEPGLTWDKNKTTGQMVPFNIPAQDRAYKSAFNEEAPQYYQLKDNPALAQKWWDMAHWKEGFMEAAWRLAANSVTQVNPKFISATQSVYGFWANTDGYYFNITRALPMISGHGGYSDWGPGYFHPSMTHEFGRMRDLDKPNWYLPAWHGGMPANQIRLEQYLSFMTNLQGLMIPPDQQVHKPYGMAAAEGIVESNKIMGRLGTIFTTMPVTRPDVAMLYSFSQIVNSQITHLQKGDDPVSSLNGDGHSLDKQWPAYIAMKLAHYSAMPIVEEDILDGTLATNHKALFIHSVTFLQPRVVIALEGYIDHGGLVLLSDDCTVQIKGAQKLGAAIDTTLYQNINKAMAAKDQATVDKLNTAGQYMNASAPLAKALASKLAAAGIKPDLDVDSPAIIVSRQAQGDIEYYFAVNATWDEVAGKLNSVKAARATVRMPADGRPVYDAVRGGLASEMKADGPNSLRGLISFGPGAMRVFARTTRPIGSVQLANPILSRQFTASESPISITITATLNDDQGSMLNGAAPLQLRLIDPLKSIRYDLYRATKNGVFEIKLPLAANDPAGKWTVEITELLSNKVTNGSFNYVPGAQCGAVAGATARAVYFGNDREHIFQFFRTTKEVTIIKGSSDYCNAAADRLVEILKPWAIRCTVIDAATANKARALPAEARPTWAPPYGGYRVANDAVLTPGQVGYDVYQSAILLGTPDDNPIIKAIISQPNNNTLLPYKADKATFPGSGRGYLAWQSNVLGFDGQESITCIAYDAKGMDEAIGTLYEAATGLAPLTDLVQPTASAVTTAMKTVNVLPEAPILWQINLPDRAASITVAGNGQLTVATIDGTISTINPTGKLLDQKPAVVLSPTSVPAPIIPEAIKAKLLADRLPKFILTGDQLSAIAYWGGTIQRFSADGTLLTQQVLPQDINALAWSGTTLLVGLSDGRLLALK